MKNTKRKGAIELSLGFIVTVVFAIVLLSLAIYWINTVIGSIGSLTDDMTQKAHDTLSDTFQTGATNFAVYPGEYTLSPGKGVKLSVGVKNDDRDGKPHSFVIRVFPAMASSNILNIYKCSKFSECENLTSEMMSWITYPETAYTVQPNSFKFLDVSVVIPNNAVKGIYQYDIVACEDMGFDECNRLTTNWGSTLSLQITVK
jgi:hypothetical protein